jgi:predicted permease
MRWRRQSREQDLDRELRCHLDLEAAEQRDAGLDPEQARDAARRALGNVTYLKEDVRSMWGWTRWDILLQDLRYAMRTLRRSPGFAATAILTLTLGIGAGTAIFTVFDTAILKPLAFPDSARLVVAWERVRWLSGEAIGPNPRHVDVWRQRATAFSGITLLGYRPTSLSYGGDHPRVAGEVVCLPNLFDVLAVRPLLGRTFLPDDGKQSRDNVAILTYPTWQSLFQGDPGAIGKTIRLDDVPREVVGVLPAGFHFPNGNTLRAFRSRQPVRGTPDPGIFIPVALDLSSFPWNGNYANWITLGRLNPGFTVSQAEAQLNAIQAQVVQQIPDNVGDRRPGALLASVEPMQQAVAGDSRTGLWLLMAAVLGLMLIACLNLANAQLGRALGRRRDAAVRTALGAAKGRLVWNALAENVVLAVIGGAGGVALAHAALLFLRRSSPVDLPRLAEAHLDTAALLFSILLTSGASLLSGLLPALRLLGSDPQAALQQSSNRTFGSRRSNHLRALLIALQVFGCTALLLVTGLFSKSLWFLLTQDKGFDTGSVAVAEVALLPKTYPTDRARAAVDDALLAKLRALPGVQAAGMVSAMPLEGERWIEPLQRVDQPPDRDGARVNARWVSPGYFEATRQKLVAGRFFEDRDANLSSVVLSEGAAKSLWGGENPIGGEVSVLGRTSQVIGVVADSRNASLKSPPPKVAYVHYSYRTPYGSFFVVRCSGAADSLLASMRRAIWSYDPDLTIARVKTLDTQLTDSLATERFQTWVLGGFGASALLLSMIGIYGVLSYSMAARKQEIGVRMALGATRRSVYALALSDTGLPVFGGLLAGLATSAIAGRAIRNLLYGTQAVDPAVILAVAGLFLLSATVAALLPARRAASLDPMDALRSE